MNQSFITLDPADYSRVRPLLDGWKYHLAAFAVLSGNAPGRVYVDDTACPSAALVQAGHRIHIAGKAVIPAFNRGLRRFFREVLPAQMDNPEDMYQLYYSHPGWESAIEEALEGMHPIKGARHLYAFREFPQDWRGLLPSGFLVRQVDLPLLSDTSMKHVDELAEEVLSESPTHEEFFKSHFGVCVTHGSEVAAWCLSEYDCPEGCEVGIATVPEYRRRGLATAAAGALVEEALARGIRWIGWHCWAGNSPSIATALRAGFELIAEYPVYYGWFDEAVNLAGNGNFRFWRGRHQEAVGWYRRAFAAGDPPGWAYWNAACACAEIDETDEAIRYLRKALDKGFGSREELLAEEHLRNLRGASGWQALVDSLDPL